MAVLRMLMTTLNSLAMNLIIEEPMTKNISPSLSKNKLKNYNKRIVTTIAATPPLHAARAPPPAVLLLLLYLLSTIVH